MPHRLTILMLLLLACAQAWSQLATVHVDATNGSDSFSGANPSDSPSGTGPKATIHAGLDGLANNGKLVIFAGIYAGDGIDTDGSPTNTADNADINISTTKYPRLTSGLTIELRALAGKNEIKVFVDPSSVRSSSGAQINHSSDQYIPNLLFNIPGGVLTITTAGGNEYISLAAAHSSGNPVSGIVLSAGSVDIQKGSSVRLLSGATITVDGTPRFLRDAPQKGNDLNLTYTGTGATTAGPESGYTSFGSGVLTINRAAESSIIFPLPMTFTGNNDAIRIPSGSATFNGALTLGSVGSQSQAPRTADLIIGTPGLVMFNAPVKLVAASTAAADSAISGIVVTGNGLVSFQQSVNWTASYNSSDVSFPATESMALVWNAGSAIVTFAAGATFTHASTTVNVGPATIEARIQNNAAGKITFGGPITVIPRTETSANGLQQFSIAAINNAGGTLEISGTLRSGLVNASSVSAGTINLLGPTTLGAPGAATGSLVNAVNKVLNLGSNTLTFSGNVSHSLSGSSIVATTGRFLVNATGAVTFDGGTLPSITVNQDSAGVTRFPAGGVLASLTVASGTCSMQSNVTVTGLVSINGGSLVLAGPAVLGSLSMASGACTIQSTLTVTGLASVNGGRLVLMDRAVLGSLSITSGTCSSQSSLTVTGLASVDGGRLVVARGGMLGLLAIASGACTLQSNTTVSGLVSVNGGALALDDSTGLSLSAGEYRQTGGVFTLGGRSGGDLRLQGNFTSSGGIFAQGPASRMILAGPGLQVFDPGSSLQLMSLYIENITGGVRLARTLFVSGTLLIGTGAKLDMGSNNIVLNKDGASFINNGSYTCTGYGIVMGGATLVEGGAAIAGSEIRAGTGSIFPSIAVDVGNLNTCSIQGSSSVTWSNMLGIISGGLDVGSAVDLRPAGPSSLIVRDVSYSSRITASSGTFNALGIHHSVRCIGNLLIDYTMAPDLIADLVNTDTLSIDVNSDITDGDGNLTTGQLRYFEFPGIGFVYGGTLRVGPTSAAQLASNGRGGESLELSAANVRHTIRGILRTAESGDRILISGSSVVIAGGTKSNEVSLIGNIVIAPSILCTITDVQGFTGSFTTLARSSVVISMGSVPSKQRIQGALRLNGESFSLAGNLEVTGGVAFNGGTLNFGTYNLQLSTSGDFLQSPGASGYTTNGGYLVMNRTGAQIQIGDSNPTGLPNLQILSNTTLAASGRVTQNLAIGSTDLNGIPTLTLGKAGNDLIFTGSTISLFSNGSGNKTAIVSDGTTNGTPGGRLLIAGSSVLMIVDGDYSIEELTFNPPSADGTLSILSTDHGPHVLTISDMLVHAGGQLGLGLNHLALTGTGTLGGQRAYNRSDGTIGATSGELRFIGTAPQQFIAGPGFSVPNLRIANTQGVTKAPGSPSMTVSGSLDLSEGLLSFDRETLVLDNGATLIRRRSTAVLSSPISYRGAINVSYLVDPDNGNLRTGVELPSEAGALKNLGISNPSVQDSSSVLLDRNITIGGTLVLDAGQFDPGSYSATLIDGGTIDLSSGRIKSSGTGAMKLSTYNLTYRKSVVVGPTAQEFQSGVGISLSRLSVLGTAQRPTTVFLTVNRSVGVLEVNAPQGGIEFGPAGSFVARNLTVKDSLSIVSGGFTNTTGTNAIINLSGTSRQILTVDSAGLMLQGGVSPIHLQLNNPAGFELRGGDLEFHPGSMLLFASGVMNTGKNAVVLSHSATGQGFDRQGVIGKNLSHIAGTLRQAVTGGAGNVNEYPNGRYEFPTGTLTSYRPLSITFTNAYPALSPGTIEVTHVVGSPGGRAGLPLDGGGGLWVGSYPNFSWKVKTSEGSFGVDQNFDLEAVIRNPGFLVSKAGDLRFIRRSNLGPETSNWSLLGAASGYATNSLTTTSPGDTVLTVGVISAGKGFVGSNLLTLGLKSQVPVLVSRLPAAAVAVKLDVPVTFTVNAVDPDNLPLTYTWKLNGAAVKTGADSSYTTTFQAFPKSVTAVFTNPAGLSDSTVWIGFGGDVSVEEGGIPAEFALEQNYPNPFNPTTNFELRIAKREAVQVRIFTVLGVEVATLLSEIREPGIYTIRWNASSFPSGIYLCQMKAGTFMQMRKMVLAK